MQKYTISGMSCAACSARVEKAVSMVIGVDSVSVSLLTNSMVVEGNATEADIISAVEKAGYKASSKNKKSSANDDNEIYILKKRLIWSVVFLFVLMYFSMGYTMWNFPLPRFFDTYPLSVGLVQLILTIIVMVINRKFFISGFKGFKNKSPNMDTLVALGSGAAFVYSIYVLFCIAANHDNKHLIHDLYFESAAMILTLITIGKTLEAHSKGKTTNALKALINLAPKTALLIKDEKELVVSADSIKPGDIFAVKPGASIPADGIIVSGSSAVDESALTGESIPIDKAKGDTVSAATINQSGYIRCRATKVGEDTTLAQIIKSVQDASSTKAPIAKVADKVSGVFVPVVMTIALLTTIVWLLISRDFGYSLIKGISVLVISCPCALGLATPVAIMVGNGVGAKNGVLFKNAESLEETGRVKIVALDKTGTITKGKPAVTDILPLNNTTQAELIQAAYSLEIKSEHPLAKAIVKKAEELNIKPTEVYDFNAVFGNGLSATYNNEALSCGSISFISPDTDTKNHAQALASAGKTPIIFKKGEKIIGIIAVADEIKEDSPKAIAELKKMGIRVVMLTGDNEKTANAVKDACGIDEVIAEVLPTEKEKVINSLKSQGKTAMVGDGINDAPALTTADTGIAIGAGTDIAIDAAQVVLINNRLTDVAAAIRLSRKTLKNIYENLFWAFIYNIIGIPLAAGVFIALGFELNPMFGAAAMSLSSFCVVSNALRLNRVNINDKKQTKKEKTTLKKELKIEGMMCPHCSGRVKAALEQIDGVESATASHETGTAVVILTKDVTDEVLKETVEAQGYKVK